MPSGPIPSAFPRVGGHLCLDFLNTRRMRDGSGADPLRDFDALLAWLLEFRAIAAEDAAASRRWRGGKKAAKLVRRAAALREAIQVLVDHLTHGGPAEPAAIRVINRVLRKSPSYIQLYQLNGSFEQKSEAGRGGAARMLGAVARSACDLLAGSDPSLLKHCENPACGLYFYDTTKNHSRRWCSMDVCGNRMKAAAHHRRLKAAAAAPS